MENSRKAVNSHISGYVQDNMKNKMNRIDELKNSLQRSIKLHEKLRDILKEEREYIIGDSIGSLPGKVSLQNSVEREIDAASREISSKFEIYQRNAINIDYQTKKEMESLFEKLREKIQEIVMLIRETIENFKKTKKEIAGKLHDFENKKYAVNAYAKLN